MRLRKSYSFCVLSCLILASANAASAQEMGQGQAHITARSDVRLALQSGPATNSAKLSRMGEAITGQLGAIRECYRDTVRARPDVQGTLRLMISVDGGGTVEVRRDELNDEGLRDCSLRALRATDFTGIRPPGAAFATLTYANSAADGVVATRARREEEDRVAVTLNDEGHPVASGGNATGEVAFAIEGLGRPDEEQVAALQRGFRAAIPILLDCRRKAARRHSPAGDTTMIVTVSRQGRAQIRVQRSSVEDPRGGRCLTRFLRRHRFEGAAAGRSRVVVTFTGNEAMPVRPEGEE